MQEAVGRGPVYVAYAGVVVGMNQPFETAELRAELEHSLGFALRSLERLDGASALNFKAVRASDGMTFAVKCSPPQRHELFNRLVEHLDVLKGSKAVRRLFEAECPKTFRGFNLLCTAWCFGVRIFPDRLTDEEFISCLDEYAAFSEAMQKSRTYLEARPIRRWRDEGLAKCRGVAGRILRPILMEMALDECDYRPDFLRVIHGDFHYGNFLFVDRKVDGYLDFEEFRLGYPADDLLRLFACATEHLRWYEYYRQRRMLHMFGLAVRHLSYSRHEWMMAINARFINKMFKRTRKVDRIGLGQALNLAWRYGFYRRMRQVVDSILPANVV